MIIFLLTLCAWEVEEFKNFTEQFHASIFKNQVAAKKTKEKKQKEEAVHGYIKNKMIQKKYLLLR